MPFDGALKVQRAGDEIVTYVGMFDIGASGAHTKVSGYPNRGFSGVARTAAGKYRVDFADVVPKSFLQMDILLSKADNAGPSSVRPTKNSFTTSSAGVSSATYENWSIGTTPAQAELANGDQVMITARFLKTK